MSETNIAPAAESSAPVESTEPKTEAVPETPSKRKYTYKADGQEFNEELDDAEIANKLSLSRAAQKRMQEASATKKQMEQFVTALQNDPMSVLKNDKIMGTKKFREIAEQFLLQQIEEESYTPEERERANKDRQLSEYQRKEKEFQAKQEAEQASRLEKQYADQYEKTIMESLNSSNLPKTPYTVKRMAALMQQNLQHGLELEPNQLAQLVKEDYLNEQKLLVGSSSAEQLIAMFGEDIANKIRKYDLAKFRQNKTNTAPAPSAQSQSQIPARMSQREYTEMLKNKFRK